jgi:hypothetical protein
VVSHAAAAPPRRGCRGCRGAAVWRVMPVRNRSWRAGEGTTLG